MIVAARWSARFGGIDAAMHHREHADDFLMRQHAFAAQAMHR